MRPWSDSAPRSTGEWPAAQTVVPLEITPTEQNLWVQGAGMFRDDPLFDEWQAAISEYRRQVDQDDETS